MLHYRVINIRANSQCQVARQCPRRGCPRKNLLPSFQLKGNGECGVLAIAIYIVHTCFCVGQRCLAAPAICQHAEALVNETLVPQCAKRPHDTFHVWRIKSFVIVVEVNPSCLTGDIPLPFVGVSKNTGATCIVELVNTEFSDCGVTSNA